MSRHEGYGQIQQHQIGWHTAMDELLGLQAIADQGHLIAVVRQHMLDQHADADVSIQDQYMGSSIH